MRCNPYNHLHNSCSKCLITKICSRVCLRVLLSCSFDLGRGEQVPSVTRAPVERRIVSGGQIPVTFEVWRCFQDTMGSNNIANILQRHYSAFRILSHSCNENFLLYIFMLKSVRRPLGVWDKVWRTQTQFTLFLFIKLLFFSGPVLLMLNILIFLPIWGLKYSCIKFLKCRFHFSMYWSPFIELSRPIFLHNYWEHINRF